MSGPRHQPVLLAEVVAALNLRHGSADSSAPQDGAIYVVGTFGAGGYSRAILEAANCTVFAIDRDPNAIAGASDLVKRFAGRLHVIQGRFGDMVELLAERGILAVNGVTLDLGVSSMQLDEAERGFSFRFDGPLDMRMEQAGESAADIVNEMAERPLADLIFTFGEEKKAQDNPVPAYPLPRNADMRGFTVPSLRAGFLEIYQVAMATGTSCVTT